MNTIKFWRTSEEYGCLSNFSRHPIIVDGRKWFTTEAYYQGMKYNCVTKQEKIRLAGNPKEAKQLGYTLGTPRPDWEEVKFDIMLFALRVKCEQNPEVKSKLLESGDAILEEASPYDAIWGTGIDGKGTNLLGKAWMLIRDELTSKKE